MKNVFLIALAALSFIIMSGCGNTPEPKNITSHFPDSFLIRNDELKLTYDHQRPERLLSFQNYTGDFESWKKEVLNKFAELTGFKLPPEREVTLLRKTIQDGITYRALLMKVSEELTIPAYLLEPSGAAAGAVMAIHGHGSVEPMIGLRDDYHHSFALELAKKGYMVLAPELRGFSTLSDLSSQTDINRLDYWGVSNSHYTLVTDGFLYGETLIGQTIEDLIAWEDWLCGNYNFENLDVAGISYGGDLALFYPVFSRRVRRIFASGSLGSFELIFSRCYNAPAHCIPGILNWMDRSDAAGLNAPRPIMLHYGELDTPSEKNHSASYNESVKPSVEELRNIYRKMQAGDKISLYVTPGKKHEMDIEALLNFLK